MMKRIMGEYAVAFRDEGWLVRLQHIYLLVVPVLLVGFILYLSGKW